MSAILKEELLGIEKIAASIYKMTIKSGHISKNARPGQFVNIKCCDGINALLRRPISICDVDRQNGTFDIVFQVRGKGTELLSKKNPGDKIDLIGPLGNSFETGGSSAKIAVVGGGIGIFPLLFLLKEMQNAEKTAYLGFRSSDYTVLLNEFAKASDKLQISTDDGTKGYKGLITDLLSKDLDDKAFDIIYTCGPTPMIRRVSELAASHGVKCQVSLEQRMGCGIGACLVCACKTKLGDEWEYSHVCKDGPVFWSNEIVWEDC